MRLAQPTDFLILEALSDGERDTGANIAQRLGKDRGYINAELVKLADYELLEKIGPHENSGLYQITPLGIAALKNQSLYGDGEETFETAIHRYSSRVEIRRPSVEIN